MIKNMYLITNINNSKEHKYKLNKIIPTHEKSVIYMYIYK